MTTINQSIKGHGYSTRGMNEISPGHYSIPMYRNSDDAELGIFTIEASSPHRAFEIARKKCYDEFSRGW